MKLFLKILKLFLKIIKSICNVFTLSVIQWMDNTTNSSKIEEPTQSGCCRNGIVDSTSIAKPKTKAAALIRIANLAHHELCIIHDIPPFLSFCEFTSKFIFFSKFVVSWNVTLRVRKGFNNLGGRKILKKKKKIPLIIAIRRRRP